VDFIAQSGLRASTPTVPNGASLPEYLAVNASIAQKVDLGIGQGTELRLDVLNIGDSVYEIRNGTGVGVGADKPTSTSSNGQARRSEGASGAMVETCKPKKNPRKRIVVA
jgi:hypothetical protein